MDTPLVTQPMVGKKTRRIYGVSIFLVVVLLAGLLLALAKTGMVEVPLFSYFYQGPTPGRVVTSPPIDPTLLGKEVQLQAAEQMVANPQATSYHLQVTETQLTGALESLAPSFFRTQDWKMEKVQLAIESSDIEVYGKFSRGFLHADVLLHAIPVINKDGLSFNVTSLRLGDYSLPPSMVHQVLSVVFARDLAHWSFALSHFTLTQIKLAPGIATIILSSATSPTTP